jgi:CheY-like chemotaxis protein
MGVVGVGSGTAPGASRILIVDDEPELVRTLTLRLRSAGYEVLCARDGMAATQLAVREQPDLIILDIGMPAGDGHTVAARLKENVRTLGIPIVFLTARASKIDAQKAQAVGAAGYLIKPYHPEELLDVISRALSPKLD